MLEHSDMVIDDVLARIVAEQDALLAAEGAVAESVAQGVD
jgi:hypothetical protein